MGKTVRLYGSRKQPSQASHFEYCQKENVIPTKRVGVCCFYCACATKARFRAVRIRLSHKMAATIVNSCTPDSGQINKGRRKLDFTESQRFKGKRFFLDLNGYRRASNLASELTARGAVSQSQLHCIFHYNHSTSSLFSLWKSS